MNLLGPRDKEIKDPRERERSLLDTVEKDSYHKVEAELTAKELMESGDNPLIMAIRVRPVMILL